MAGGRPRIIDSPESLMEQAELYFAQSFAHERPVTITGLAYALGLSSRQSLIEYENRPEFSDTVKRVKLRVEQAYEERLWSNAPAGAIFALKNMEWSDRQDHRIGGHDGGPIEVIERVIVDGPQGKD